MLHTTRKTHLIGLMIALLLVMAGSTALAQNEESSGFRPDAPQYGVRGPYAVGTVDMQIEDVERPITLTVWYPADATEGFVGDHVYALDYSPGVGVLEVFGKALPDATPASENAPYPLVIYSHGFTFFRLEATYFAEHLASWGFVVMAPDHPDMHITTFGSPPEFYHTMYLTTPQDVSRVIDFAEAQNKDGMLEGLINTDKIAMTGHSSGGFTALQASGGQLDLEGMLAECEVNPEHFDCPFVMPMADEIAALYGIEGVTDELLPSAQDERIDVVIPMAPDQIFFGQTGLNNVTIPTLYLVGDLDEYITYDQFSNGFASLGSDTAYMVTFEYGGHGIFGDTCQRAPFLVGWGLFSLCADPVWDKDRTHDLIDHYGTAFLLWHLKADTLASEVFGEGQMEYPGVELLSK